MKKRLFFIATGLLLTLSLHARQQKVSEGALQWPLHGWAQYQVQFTTRVLTDFASLGTQGQDTSLAGALQGAMRTECVAASAGQQYFHARFTNIERCRFPLPAVVQQTIRDLLGAGFYYSRSYSGLVDSIWFPGEVTEAAEHVVVQLLEPFQWSYPLAAAGAEQPIVALSDGLARATYRQSSSDSCTKQLRLDSLAWIIPGGQPGVLARRIEYTVDSRYCFSAHYAQAVQGQVIRKAKVNHKTVTTLTNTFSYQLSASGGQGDLPDARYAALYARPLFHPGRLEQKLRENLQAKGKRLTISGVLKALKQNEQLQDVNRQDALAEAVKICLVTNKDSLDLLRKAFLAAPVESITFKTMRTGIVTASTVYAQQVLSDFMRLNRNAADKLKKLIPSAGLVRTPSVLLQQTVEQLAFDSTASESLTAAAMLALGNMAGSLRQEDVDRSDTLTQKLGRLLTVRGDDMLLLSVMGNCGTPVVMPFILPFLSHTDTTTMAYAYYALRFIHTAFVDSVYRSVLTPTQHPVVLTNVFNALFLRTGNEALTAALLRLVDAATEPVRLEALQVVFEWSYREPGLLAAVRDIAAHNASDAVKKAARQFLARAEE